MAAAKDLITLTRAYQSLPAALSGTIDTLLGSLITSASDWIEKYCRRRFVSQTFDELYNGNGERRLLLRQYPIINVVSVRYRPVTVLKVTNTQAANVQARVTVLSTGLQLVQVNAGVRTTVTTGLDYTSNRTLTAMAAAINGVGSGWSAQVVGDSTNYGGWPSEDLWVPGSYGDALETKAGATTQGALNAAGTQAELKMHTYELQGYQWDARGWLLRAIPYTDPELLHPEDLIFPIGINNFRVQYTAGYATVPESVQEACAEMAAMWYYLSLRDPQLAQTVASGGSASAYVQVAQDGKMPGRITSLLAPSVRHVVSVDQG